MNMIIDFIKFGFLTIFGLVFFIFVVGGVLYFIYCAIGGCEADRRKEEALQECFMQEPRTKDCEYMIWKYEIEHAKPKNSSSFVPMPIIIK